MRESVAASVLLLLAVSCSPVCATVDPDNATSIVYDRQTYNVTHEYFRQAFSEMGIRVSPEGICLQTQRDHIIHYWVDQHNLPEQMTEVDADGRKHALRTPQSILGAVDSVVSRVFGELRLHTQPIQRDQYYSMLDKLQLSPGRRHQGLWPLRVHFRKKPYPQSSFGELVTDRQTNWHVYHDRQYAKNAGISHDLLYRYRHNLRHSLGLGHNGLRTSIMYPTNVLGLASATLQDTLAVHCLLCDERCAQPGGGQILSFGDLGAADEEHVIEL